MGAFGNVYKITPKMFAVWMRLLARMPEAVLWLIDDNPTTTENLKNHARSAQADLSRIIFSARSAHKEFCARLKLCDVYLDTYPYNCGSTTNDVIRAGVPLVTRYGKSMVSRMGLSILKSIGLESMGAVNFDGYETNIKNLKDNKIKIKNHIPSEFYLFSELMNED